MRQLLGRSGGGASLLPRERCSLAGHTWPDVQAAAGHLTTSLTHIPLFSHPLPPSLQPLPPSPFTLVPLERKDKVSEAALQRSVDVCMHIYTQNTHTHKTHTHTQNTHHHNTHTHTPPSSLHSPVRASTQGWWGGGADTFLLTITSHTETHIPTS